MTEAEDRLRRLADGSTAPLPEELFHRLGELGIEAPTIHHPPVHTVEEAKLLRGNIVGCHTKSLFLRNKKGNMWLVSCAEDQPVDLKSLGQILGGGRLSFCSADRLMKFLGLTPGSVSPFGVINDNGRVVRVVLEKKMLQQQPLNFHPLDNSMTSSITTGDLMRFLQAENHPPLILGL
jgi:Ala-tRNA(Pro) deacylase